MTNDGASKKACWLVLSFILSISDLGMITPPSSLVDDTFEKKTTGSCRRSTNPTVKPRPDPPSGGAQRPSREAAASFLS